MKKRTIQQWQTLISEYETSGLTQTAFCKEHEICRKHFGKRRTALLNQAKLKTTRSFIPVAIATRDTNAMLELHHNNELLIKIPLSASPDWLAKLLQQLSV